jgi:hypothetical protein
MFFGCTVVSTMTRARSPGFIAPVLVATARLSCNSAAGYNFRRLIRWLSDFLRLILAMLFAQSKSLPV